MKQLIIVLAMALMASTSVAQTSAQQVSPITVGTCVYPHNNPKNIQVFESNSATVGQKGVLGFEPYMVNMTQLGRAGIWRVSDDNFVGWVNKQDLEVQDLRNCN